MMKLKKLVISLLAVIILIPIFLAMESHALTSIAVTSDLILDAGFDIIPGNKGGFYILSYKNDSDNCSLVNCDFSNSNPVPSVEVQGTPTTKDYIAVDYNSPYMYIFYPTKVVRLRIQKTSAQALDYITGLNLDKQKHALGLTIGSNQDIFMCASDSNSVSVYNSSGEISGTKLSASTPIGAIATDISKTYLYAATNNALYRYKIGTTPYEFDKGSISENVIPFKFLTDNIFITPAGKIYTLDDTEFKLSSTVNSQTAPAKYPEAVAIAGFDKTSILVKTADKTVSRISSSSGSVTGTIKFEENVLAISTSDTNTIVVTGSETAKEIYLIAANDISDVTPVQPSTPEEDDGTDDNSITSEEYKIDEVENIISKIPAGTTWGTFKNGLIFNGFSLTLQDSDNMTKISNSAKLATGYKITFIKDGLENKTFTLIVDGDVTGSGSISTKSASALVDHLLGKSELEGAFLEAADLSGSNNLSTVDLLLMYKEMQK